MEPVPFRLFISYRRADTEGYAGWLHYCLEERYGTGSVFRDIGGIDAGVEFMAEVKRAINQCHGVLSVIGRTWATASDPLLGRRLDLEDDPVRKELEIALGLRKQIVPVLIEGAPMPRADELPESLRPLTGVNALPMSDARWKEDLERLGNVLDNIRASKAAGGKMTGADIVAAFREGTGAPTWVGRKFGLKGKDFREDCRTGDWRKWPYEVKFGGGWPGKFWFPVGDFVEAVQGE